jgi:hypothetical protein
MAIKTIKLMACQNCGDLVRLARPIRYCRCRSSVGRQQNTQIALVAGPCLIFGLNQNDYEVAIQGGIDRAKPLRWYVVSEDNLLRTDTGEFAGTDEGE